MTIKLWQKGEKSSHETRVVTIKDVVQENASVTTFLFEDTLCVRATPGQFVMIWLPSVDEIPLSLSKIGKNAAVTVKDVGEATKAFCKKEKGDKIGIRGPFGRGFSPVDGSSVIVAGGTGLCAIRPLVYEQMKRGDVTLLLGAKAQEDLFFMDELRRILSKTDALRVTTEDGSLGTKGVVTDLLAEYLTADVKMVYTCGPERMMRKVYEITERHEVPLQASLERVIRCGIGLCGSCSFGPYLVCRDGPVFHSKHLREVQAFGYVKRDFTGKKVEI
ncbi:MAG: dihydroorotate dehydrogenase electron transfer subunit [Candidatus Korarchaeota archaeon]|nr:dihydroorotate dehydrogenase electron transfer subunit [Candidatus Korarchaeota archaeon]NIU82276.1 dihydroorotate dehydrogenase electron transfer subunit [Candidatus Thorarchaeota archaeon]NIW12730.1 dihydroorotate dehydrogenase electron transfer subunit [Candidatus Thorarchaeota archaeon]NIW50941.1 dihydroorotate dehydrogenase electron transfer subunit [Candidatus Korarchaeota archaeon]